jgi:hypothetical protein
VRYNSDDFLRKIYVVTLCFGTPSMLPANTIQPSQPFGFVQTTTEELGVANGG